MPQSLTKLYAHLIFSTKNRQPLLDDAIRPRVHAQDPSANNLPILAGCGYGYERQAASTYRQYVCFAFLRSLVLAAPKQVTYLRTSPYLATVIRDLDSKWVVVGGIADHVHLLFDMGKMHAPVKFVEHVKRESSKFVKTLGTQYEKFYWQREDCCPPFGKIPHSPQKRCEVFCQRLA